MDGKKSQNENGQKSGFEDKGPPLARYGIGDGEAWTLDILCNSVQRRSLFWKLPWYIINLAIFLVCAHYLRLSALRYMHPTTFVSTLIRDPALKFPTVTICNMNPYKMKALEELAMGRLGDASSKYEFNSKEPMPIMPSDLKAVHLDPTENATEASAGSQKNIMKRDSPPTISNYWQSSSFDENDHNTWRRVKRQVRCYDPTWSRLGSYCYCQSIAAAPPTETVLTAATECAGLGARLPMFDDTTGNTPASADFNAFAKFTWQNVAPTFDVPLGLLANTTNGIVNLYRSDTSTVVNTTIGQIHRKGGTLGQMQCTKFYSAPNHYPAGDIAIFPCSSQISLKSVICQADQNTNVTPCTTRNPITTTTITSSTSSAPTTMTTTSISTRSSSSTSSSSSSSMTSTSTAISTSTVALTSSMSTTMITSTSMSTSTSTVTPTSSPMSTSTLTSMPTSTSTPTPTPSSTSTSTLTPMPTTAFTSTPTPSSTSTSTLTPMPTSTSTPTSSPSSTSTSTLTPMPTSTLTTMPTSTSTSTSLPSSTSTSTSTLTPMPTTTFTSTPTSASTVTPMPTSTTTSTSLPSSTSTSTSTLTSMPTTTFTSTPTPSSTSTSTVTPMPTSTSTPRSSTEALTSPSTLTTASLSISTSRQVSTFTLRPTSTSTSVWSTTTATTPLSTATENTPSSSSTLTFTQSISSSSTKLTAIASKTTPPTSSLSTSTAARTPTSSTSPTSRKRQRQLISSSSSHKPTTVHLSTHQAYTSMSSSTLIHSSSHPPTTTVWTSTDTDTPPTTTTTPAADLSSAEMSTSSSSTTPQATFQTMSSTIVSTPGSTWSQSPSAETSAQSISATGFAPTTADVQVTSTQATTTSATTTDGETAVYVVKTGTATLSATITNEPETMPQATSVGAETTLQFVSAGPAATVQAVTKEDATTPADETHGSPSIFLAATSESTSTAKADATEAPIALHYVPASHTTMPQRVTSASTTLAADTPVAATNPLASMSGAETTHQVGTSQVGSTDGVLTRNIKLTVEDTVPTTPALAANTSTRIMATTTPAMSTALTTLETAYSTMAQTSTVLAMTPSETSAVDPTQPATISTAHVTTTPLVLPPAKSTTIPKRTSSGSVSEVDNSFSTLISASVSASDTGLSSFSDTSMDTPALSAKYSSSLSPPTRAGATQEKVSSSASNTFTALLTSVHSNATPAASRSQDLNISTPAFLNSVPEFSTLISVTASNSLTDDATSIVTPAVEPSTTRLATKTAPSISQASISPSAIQTPSPSGVHKEYPTTVSKLTPDASPIYDFIVPSPTGLNSRASTAAPQSHIDTDTTASEEPATPETATAKLSTSAKATDSPNMIPMPLQSTDSSLAMSPFAANAPLQTQTPVIDSKTPTSTNSLFPNVERNLTSTISVDFSPSGPYISPSFRSAVDARNEETSSPHTGGVAIVKTTQMVFAQATPDNEKSSTMLPLPQSSPVFNNSLAPSMTAILMSASIQMPVQTSSHAVTNVIALFDPAQITTGETEVLMQTDPSTPHIQPIPSSARNPIRAADPATDPELSISLAPSNELAWSTSENPQPTVDFSAKVDPLFSKTMSLPSKIDKMDHTSLSVFQPAVDTITQPSGVIDQAKLLEKVADPNAPMAEIIAESRKTPMTFLDILAAITNRSSADLIIRLGLNNMTDDLAKIATINAALPYLLANLPLEVKMKLGYDDVHELILLCTFMRRNCTAELHHWYSNSLGNCYSFNHIAREEKLLTRLGQEEGLRIYFDTKASSYMPTTQSAAVMALVSNRGLPLLPSIDGWIVSPGLASSGAVTYFELSKVVNCLAENANIGQGPGEQYSLHACWDNCFQNMAVEQCGCIDPSRDVNASTPATYCELEQKPCIDKLTKAQWSSISRCNCKDSCFSRVFDLSETRLRLRPHGGYFSHPNSLVESSNVDNIGLLEVYANNFQYVFYKEDWIPTLLDSFLDMANLIGLFLSFSMISFVEILSLPYYIFRD